MEYRTTRSFEARVSRGLVTASNTILLVTEIQRWEDDDKRNRHEWKSFKEAKRRRQLKIFAKRREEGKKRKL